MQRDTGFCKSLVKSQSTIMTKAVDGDSNKKNNKDVEDYMNGYPWPPRCYPCSFCKREFKSAQALGGHMNVHRKDRARLRSSPPPTSFIGQYTRGTILNLNLISNPNRNLVSSPPPPSSSPFSSVSTKQLPPSTTSSRSVPLWMSNPYHPPHTFSSPSGPCHSENMKRVVGGTLSSPSLDLKTLDLSTQMKNNAQSSEEDGCMKLDLEIGVHGGNSKDDIDLELRLGCF